MNAKKAASGNPVLEATMRLGKALGHRALDQVGNKVGSVTENLMTFGQGGDSGSKSGDGGGAGGGKNVEAEASTIVVTADVGVPIDVAYDEWTRFTDFPKYMRTVKSVDQNEDDELTWQAKMFWSKRTWTSTIVEQQPDEQIIWRSTGNKGYADGAVTFHELAPSLTRIVLVLEYHPKGLFEHLGNFGRMQTHRARQDLRRFQRHVMTHTVLHAEDLHGWRGEIHDGEVTPPEEIEEDEPDTEENDTEENDTEEPATDEPPRARRTATRRKKS